MPSFVRVDKENLPQLYSSEESLNLGLIPHGVRINGSGLIFTTGIAVWPCLKAMESLKSKDIESNVIDIFRIKPLNKPLLISLTKNVSWVLCVEECLNLSSLSEVLAKEIINTSNVKLFKSINLGENFLLGSAKREWAWKKFNLNADAITNYVTNNIIGNINE
jgi:transketolase C-terminal domain/subunit